MSNGNEWDINLSTIRGIPTYHRTDYASLTDTNREKGEHKTCWSWLEYEYPWLACDAWHTANERLGNKRHGSELKQMGVMSGVSDFIIAAPVGEPSAFIELKREQKKGSQPTPDQRKFLIARRDHGHFVAVCHGAEAFKVAVMDYLQLRRLMPNADNK